MEINKCKFCNGEGDNLDLLTGYNFCTNCFNNLKATSRHMYFNHVKEKLKERHGIDLTVATYHEIIGQINDSSRHTLVSSGNTKHRKIHRVFVNGAKVFVVYRKGKLGALVTALPKKTYTRGILIK